MQTNELKNRAERLVARAEALPNLGMMQRAEQAVILAQETAALISNMCQRLDAMTPYIDEA